MEPTSEPENTRQSRGLARFWPVHGIPAPAPRQSDEDPDASQATAGAAAHASDQPAGAAGPTGEHPQVSDQQSHPHDDQQESDEQSPNPFAPRPHPALTSDTQMVALGSRRPADALLGGNGARWTNQGGFPPVETNGHRNGDAGPRHGGTPVANGQAPVGSGPLPGSRSPFAPAGDSTPPSSFAQPGDDARSALSSFAQPGDDARSAFIPGGNDESPRSAFIPAGNEESPRSAFIPADDAAPSPRSPFAPTGNDGPPGARSPFAPAEDDGPAGPPFAPSPFAPQASGSAQVTSAGQQAAPGAATVPPQQPARPVSASPSAAGSAQVPMPMPGRPVSTPPAPAPAAVPHALKADPSAPNRLEPTRLEPTGWATASPRAGEATAGPRAGGATAGPRAGEATTGPRAGEAAAGPRAGEATTGPRAGEATAGPRAGGGTAGPRAGASGSAAVPVSAPVTGRRSRDDEAPDERAAPAPRRSAGADDAPETSDRRPARAETAEAPLRPGDVNDISITFWAESASEQFRAEWHEVKAQFVDDPVAALTRAHDLLTEAVHELTESMLAERDDLDPLRAGAKPDTESMRMAMRGYREFLDRILAL